MNRDLKLYSVEELAVLLGVPVGELEKLLEDGRLRGKKLAGKWFIPASAVEDFFGLPQKE